MQVGNSHTEGTYTPGDALNLTASYLLNENGSYILLEDGGRIIISGSTTYSTVGDDISSATFTPGNMI